MKGLLLLLAKRYIAGAERKDAIDAARGLNSQGILATIDHLGENIRNETGAEESVREYISLLAEIKEARVSATVSMKLTHLGLDISEDLAFRNAETIIKKASECANFVWLDMEGSPYTQRTIELFLKLRAKYTNVGIAIQSYLLRSAGDIKRLIECNASVRLVKGAYKEPPEIAFKDKNDVDRNFELLMKELLSRGAMPAIATHDERLIGEAVKLVKERNIPAGRFEFQMLLGIKRKLQTKLAAEGYRMRVYIPYGKDWLPYTMRRLRERKENIYFVVRNIFD
ncbi:MAG: proline dehydrogenase family protein [Deltaproteobacteria bacterium]|nr:proline dehydrogenase family protein [Deltaproteobacteria bacterium]